MKGLLMNESSLVTAIMQIMKIFCNRFADSFLCLHCAIQDKGNAKTLGGRLEEQVSGLLDFLGSV